MCIESVLSIHHNVKESHRKSEKFDLLVMQEEKLEDHQIQQDSSSGHHECPYKSSAEIFQPVPKENNFLHFKDFQPAMLVSIIVKLIIHYLIV